MESSQAFLGSILCRLSYIYFWPHSHIPLIINPLRPLLLHAFFRLKGVSLFCSHSERDARSWRLYNFCLPCCKVFVNGYALLPFLLIKYFAYKSTSSRCRHFTVYSTYGFPYHFAKRDIRCGIYHIQVK